MKIIFDFLFPKAVQTLELEAIPSSELLQMCPPPEPIEEKDVLAIFSYKDETIKSMVWEVKYKGNEIIANTLAEILYDALHHEIFELALFDNSWRQRPIFLVSIPASRSRERERGWNQAELLARKLVKFDKEKLFKYLPRQLVKTHHTESQTKTHSKQEREKNLINSMKISDEAGICNQCIVVVDDVVTTGSTFKEARRALYAAGAKNILCVAIAH